jgi:hypothetical protein
MVPARLHLSANALVVQLLFPRLLSRVTLLSHWQRQLARSNRGHALSSSKLDIIITCLRLCFLASLRRLSLRCKVNWLESAVEFSPAPHGSIDAGSYAVHSHHHTHLGKSSDEIADFVGVEFDLQPANW